MSVYYTYPHSNFMNGVINSDRFNYEIINSSISGTLEKINVDYFLTGSGFNCYVYFIDKLSDEDTTTLSGLVASHDGSALTKFVGELDNYIDTQAYVTDAQTGISGTFINMQVLSSRRELYNDTENPLYVDGFQPLLGVSGSVTSVQNDVSAINTALSKNGWYTQYIKSWTYPNPDDLLIYYGWLNSFNSDINVWNNEKVAQDLAQYNYIVLGDGIQDPYHGDYINTEIIIPRVKVLNQNVKIFGYVTANQTLESFQTKVDQWDVLQIDGVFIDEAGYDYGVTRSGLNDCIEYVHGRTYATVCFVNAWNVDHVLGTENDASYPNTTYNPNLIASSLINTDWYLLESFPINTSSYTSTGGYESKSDWAARGVKANSKRSVYGINVAAVGIIDNFNSNGQELFNFGFVSAMMWNLEAFGTSDSGYGANSAAVKHWDRPFTENLGREWTVSPSVQNDVVNNDVYWRYLDFGRLKLDFSSSAQRSDIIKFTPIKKRRIKFAIGELSDGSAAAPHKTSAGPVTGWAFNDTVEESVYGNLEIPVLWKRDTDAVATVKFFNDYSQEGIKKCQWNIDYQIIKGGVVVSDVNITTVSGVYTLSNNVRADTAMYLEIPIAYNNPGNLFVRGNVMYFRLYRYTALSNNMSNDAILTTIYFDFEEAEI